MKKLLGILVLGLLLSGCAIKHVDAGKDPHLGEYGQFIKHQAFREVPFKQIYYNVHIESKTPKSIVIWFRNNKVSHQEVTNLAQYHCQKIDLDAMLMTSVEEKDSTGYKLGFTTSNYICD